MSTPSPDNDREFLTFHPDVEPMPVGVIDTILLSLLTCVLGGVLGFLLCLVLRH
jgi:hypothetical protein